MEGGGHPIGPIKQLTVMAMRRNVNVDQEEEAKWEKEKKDGSEIDSRSKT